ncbi:MAG: hypothetical protein R3356_08370 [Eudoraea sp.]|nr:hypothetical protein [Eudoraea sp.]
MKTIEKVIGSVSLSLYPGKENFCEFWGFYRKYVGKINQPVLRVINNGPSIQSDIMFFA